MLTLSTSVQEVSDPSYPPNGLAISTSPMSDQHPMVMPGMPQPMMPNQEIPYTWAPTPNVPMGGMQPYPPYTMMAAPVLGHPAQQGSVEMQNLYPTASVNVQFQQQGTNFGTPYAGVFN